MRSKRRFAATGRSQHGEEFAGIDAQVHAGDYDALLSNTRRTPSSWSATPLLTVLVTLLACTTPNQTCRTSPSRAARE